MCEFLDVLRNDFISPFSLRSELARLYGRPLLPCSGVAIAVYNSTSMESSVNAGYCENLMVPYVTNEYDSLVDATTAIYCQ